MKCIVGLGNPGSQYALNRHNAGRIALDQRLHDQSITGRSHDKTAQTEIIKSDQLIILKPLTYMNLSGHSVQTVCHFYKIKPEDILVIHDEIDLAFGEIKLKQGGGHAGHNGLRDIIAKLGTNTFSRIRIGVGRPSNGQDVASYVLSNFNSDELTQLYHERTTIDQMISGFVK